MFYHLCYSVLFYFTYLVVYNNFIAVKKLMKKKKKQWLTMSIPTSPFTSAVRATLKLAHGQYRFKSLPFGRLLLIFSSKPEKHESVCHVEIWDSFVNCKFK